MCIAMAVACGSFALAFFALDLGMGWSITAGVVFFMVCNFVFGMVIKTKIQAVMDRVQLIMADGQKKIQAKMQRWQIRPPGSVQAAQREIEADMRVFVKDALAATEGLRKYRLLVPMIDRQMATAQVQLNWMIKEYKKVDELMPKALMIDPSMTAIKLARLQMLDAPVDEMRKVYEKGVRRLRYNQNALLAGCWSWILVKRGLVDDAFKVLTEALKNSDNETLKANHEHLMNNRVAHFSNSGLGDQWYSLQLEEPRVRTQRQRPMYR